MNDKDKKSPRPPRGENISHRTDRPGGGISGKSQSGFSHYNGKGWSYDVEWYACGK